ncbi:MAG: hypothetical protein B7X35_09230, partial [Halothiobacillus sp. 14-56-357]
MNTARRIRGQASSLVIFMAMTLVTAEVLINSPVRAADAPPPGISRVQGDNSDTDKVTLNFRDMDIGALIEAVSKVTGKNFIVDPR